MEVKKSPNADLKNKKFLFVEIGFVLSLLVVLGAFNFSSKEKKVATLEAENTELIEEEIIPITQETPPPPPEAPKIPVLSDQIDIVDDDIKIDNTIIDLEDNDFAVEIRDYVEEVQEEVVEEEAIPFQLVEEKPKFNGQDPSKAFSEWVGKNLNYPDLAKENGVSGRVMLQFTVNPNGTVSDVKVLRGVDPSLDKEAVRVVQSSPKWTPGKQRDRAVKVTYTFPVIFQLR